MTAKDEYTIEMMALHHYTEYWEVKEADSKYDTRWEKLQHAIYDKDTFTINSMVREACTRAYLAGAVFRITGGNHGV